MDAGIATVKATVGGGSSSRLSPRTLHEGGRQAAVQLVLRSMPPLESAPRTPRNVVNTCAHQKSLLSPGGAATVRAGPLPRWFRFSAFV